MKSKYFIVANNIMIKKLRSIDGFKMELGKSRRDKDNENINFTDDFSFNYKQNFERLIDKVGSLGIIEIYYDGNLTSTEMVVFKDSFMYDIEYDLYEITNIRDYLSKLLYKIDNSVLTHNVEVNTVENNTNKKWTSENEKNKGKSYKIKQDLSKEDYIKELTKKRTE